MKMPKSAVLISIIAITGLIIMDLFAWSTSLLHFYFSSPARLLGAIFIALFGVVLLLSILFQWDERRRKKRF